MLSIQQLSRSYGPLPALEAVSFEVAAGETVALLGPPGAGKTTLLRLAMGLIRADSGGVRIAGHDPAGDPGRTRPLAGYMPAEPGFDPDLTAGENLALFAAVAGLDAGLGAARVEQALRRAGIKPGHPEPAGLLGRDTLVRLSFARALLHEPSVLLLDEPTAEVGSEVADQLRAEIATLAAAGKAVLLATSDVEEARSLGQRIVILDRRVLAADTLAGLTLGRGPRRVALRLGRLGSRELDLLQRLPFVKGFDLDQGAVRVRLMDPERELADLVARLGEIGTPVGEAWNDDPTLEDVYRRLLEAAEAA